MLPPILAIIRSYLLGSIPFSIIIVRLLKGVDVRDFGSKNAGATNVYRVAGLKVAILVGLLDMAKGFMAVYWVSDIFNSGDFLTPGTLRILCTLAVILGHMYTIFAGFRGGKGVLTAAGALLAMLPLEVGLSFAIFAIILALTRYVSLGSIVAVIFLCLFSFIEKYVFNKIIPQEILYLTILVALVVIFAHRSNIARLLAGTENKIGRKPNAA